MSISSQLPSCASSSSSIRLAPAEKFGASLPTTSAEKLAAASFTPACIIWMVSPPIAFIFEWNSSARTPSPRSTRLAPAFLRTTRLRSLAERSSCRSAAAAGTPSWRKRSPAVNAFEASRERGVVVAEDRLRADGVDDLEGTQLPAEAPLHRAVDIVDRVGDVRPHLRRVAQRRPERVAQELSDLVLAEIQGLDSLAGVVDRPRRRRAQGASPTASAGTSASPDRASESPSRSSFFRACRSPGRTSHRPSRAR